MGLIPVFYHKSICFKFLVIISFKAFIIIYYFLSALKHVDESVDDKGFLLITMKFLSVENH